MHWRRGVIFLAALAIVLFVVGVGTIFGLSFHSAFMVAFFIIAGAIVGDQLYLGHKLKKAMQDVSEAIKTEEALQANERKLVAEFRRVIEEVKDPAKKAELLQVIEHLERAGENREDRKIQ